MINYCSASIEQHFSYIQDDLVES